MVSRNRRGVWYREIGESGGIGGGKEGEGVDWRRVCIAPNERETGLLTFHIYCAKSKFSFRVIFI